jgi:hypothetical protein
MIVRYRLLVPAGVLDMSTSTLSSVVPGIEGFCEAQNAFSAFIGLRLIRDLNVLSASCSG